MNRLWLGPVLLVLMLPVPLCAQTATKTSQSGTGAITTTPDPTVEKEKPPKSREKTDFHLEMGGFYSPFVPGHGSLNWRGWDVRLTYTGIKRIAPFGGVARISNGNGSQSAYSIGSYLTFTKWFYAIWGISAAQQAKIQFSPHRRYDVAGIFSVPKVKGMAFSAGLTELPAYGNSGGGRIIALGDIYYWRKFIFSGSVNLNFARPGNQRSVSGQFSATYGLLGKYYLAGGMSGGGAAYMLIADKPFEVRYQTFGAFAILTKWLAKHAGITCRYDYSRIVDSHSERHAIRTGLFYEF
jgi:YaiO family outer membrane protein